MTDTHRYIYKVVPQAVWAEAPDPWPGAPIDLADGFVHLSSAGQLAGTLVKHFTALPDLLLLWVDPAALDDLRWEVSRGGQPFPHAYGPLPHAAVVRTELLKLDEHGRHVLGAGFETTE
jgi:uncharacterized protein (DUF952 family)